MLARSLGLASLAVLPWLPLGCTPPSAPPLRPRPLAQPAVSVAPSARSPESDSYPTLDSERPRGTAPRIVSLAVSAGSTFAVDDQGRLYGWGQMVPGPGGLGQMALRPVRISGIEDALWVQGSRLDWSFCVSRRAHPLTCWGPDFLYPEAASEPQSLGSGEGAPMPLVELSALRPARPENLVLNRGWACELGPERKARCVDASGPSKLVPPEWSSIQSLMALPWDNVMAVTSKGVRCASLDRPTDSSCELPDAIAGLVLPGLRQLSLSAMIECALQASEVRCWATEEALGRGGWDQKTPLVIPALQGAEQIAIEREWVDGRFPDGRVVRVQLIPKQGPAETVLPSGAQALAAQGSGHACALLMNGGVRCWGDDHWGKLGDNAQHIVQRPRLIEGLSGARHVWVDIDTYVLRSDGAVVRYGAGEQQHIERGALVSQGAPSDDVLMCPVPDSQSSLFRRGPRGSVSCAGGELASAVQSVGAASGGRDPTSAARGFVRPKTVGAEGGEPILLPSGLPVRSVALWYDQACAVDVAGTVYCDTEESQDQMHRVEGLPRVRDVVSAGGSFCALTESGQVYCWGRNDMGQLGAGDHLPHTGPVRALGLSHVVQLAAKYVFVCALTESGQVYCWGNNDRGQTGQPTASSNSPAVEPWW